MNYNNEQRQRTRNPGFAIHKDSGGFRVYRNGSACDNTRAKTRAGAMLKQKALVEHERVWDTFLFGGKKKPLQGGRG